MDVTPDQTDIFQRLDVVANPVGLLERPCHDCPVGAGGASAGHQCSRANRAPNRRPHRHDTPHTYHRANGYIGSSHCTDAGVEQRLSGRDVGVKRYVIVYAVGSFQVG